MADMTLEEALAAATVDDGTETAYCTVDDDTRLVTIPDKYKKLGVESDEKAKRVWFRFPKLVGNNGVDLSAIGVRINFRNANGDGDIYMVKDVTIDGDYVTFSWELTRRVTDYKGHISFVVCAVKSATDGTTKNEWNTTLNKECEVLEGLEVTEQIAQENPDIIEYILANLGGSVSSEEIATAVEEYMAAHPIEVPKNLSDLNEDETHRTVTDNEKEQWNKAEENVQSDWNETDTTSDSFIKNKPSIPSKTSDLQNDSGYLTEHQDLSGYALKNEVPKTASDIGADAAGTADNKVADHNTALDAHSDIRLLIEGLTTRLNALADSDDTTLDQMSEVVAYIKSNKSLIDVITTSKVNASDIIDNLTTNASNKPLSAAQGVALKALIDAIVVPSKTSDLQNDSNFISSPATAEVGQVLEVEAIDEAGKPTSWKTVTLEDGIANVEMSSTDTDMILEPMPKAYIFPEMASLTISLTEGKETEMYHFLFISGETATTLTLNGITVATDSASVEASKTYEVDIWNQIAIVRAVA